MQHCELQAEHGLQAEVCPPQVGCCAAHGVSCLFVLCRLLALGEDGSKYIDTFRFPSCCLCHKIEQTLLGKLNL